MFFQARMSLAVIQSLNLLRNDLGMSLGTPPPLRLLVEGVPKVFFPPLCLLWNREREEGEAVKIRSARREKRNEGEEDERGVKISMQIGGFGSTPA